MPMSSRSRSLSALAFTLLLSTAGIAAAADLEVIDAYARAVPAGQMNSAAFMQLKNNSAENRAVVDAKSSISKVVELHTHRNEGGMMRMRRIPEIAVTAHSTTELKPGGLHIMFIGLNQALNPGDTVELELLLDNGDRIPLSLPVKPVHGMMHKQHMQH